MALKKFGSLAALGLVLTAAHAASNIQISRQAVTMEHVIVSSARPYAKVKDDIERRLGKLDEHIRLLAKEKRLDELRDAVQQAAGQNGLLWHYTGTHGVWLQMKGGEVKPVTEYFVGNILAAAEMTSVNYAAGLYAPLRIVLYQNAEGGSTIEYDLPSSQLHQFQSAQIDAVGKELDERLLKFVMTVQQDK